MKILLLIAMFFLFLACNEAEDRPSNTAETKITPGVYYTEQSLSSDTIQFQTKKTNSILRSWNISSWKFTKDSLFQHDRKGLYFYLGMDCCSYRLNNDTLMVKYLRLARGGARDSSCIYEEDIYKVITNCDSLLTVVRLNSRSIADDSKASESQSIRSDIQLR